MANVESRMRNAVVMLSEAKHLNRENRPFAALRVTIAALRVTIAALRVTIAAIRVTIATLRVTALRQP
jgi:hypothetical protein